MRGAGLRRLNLSVITMNVTIDDSLPPGPGNWLDLPKAAVPAWAALTLDERRQVLAGRGPNLLINLMRQPATGDQSRV